MYKIDKYKEIQKYIDDVYDGIDRQIIIGPEFVNILILNTNEKIKLNIIQILREEKINKILQ